MSAMAASKIFDSNRGLRRFFIAYFLQGCIKDSYKSAEKQIKRTKKSGGRLLSVAQRFVRRFACRQSVARLGSVRTSSALCAASRKRSRFCRRFRTRRSLNGFAFGGGSVRRNVRFGVCEGVFVRRIGGSDRLAECEKNNDPTVKKLTQKMLGTLAGNLYLCNGFVC